MTTQEHNTWALEEWSIVTDGQDRLCSETSTCFNHYAKLLWGRTSRIPDVIWRSGLSWTWVSQIFILSCTVSGLPTTITEPWRGFKVCVCDTHKYFNHDMFSFIFQEWRLFDMLQRYALSESLKLGKDCGEPAIATRVTSSLCSLIELSVICRKSDV